MDPHNGLNSRSVWEDRFRTPRPDQLADALEPKAAAALFRDARRAFTATPGVKESISWLGVPWRWTFVYSHPLDPTRAWVYLVPNPARVQIAIPLTVPMIEALPSRRLKKFVRDGIVFARTVAGIYWPSWDLSTPAQLADLLDLAARKHRFFTESAQSAPPKR